MEVVDSHQDLSVKTVLSEFLCLVLLICREDDLSLLLKFLELLLFIISSRFILHSIQIILVFEIGDFLSHELDLPLYLSILFPQAFIRSLKSFVTLVNVFQFSKLI